MYCKNLIKMKRTLLFIAFALACGTAMAQVEKNENRVRIVVNENGKKKVIERTFSDEADLDKEVKLLEDTLNSKTSQKKIITVDVRKSKGLLSGNDKDIKILNFRGATDGSKDMIIVTPDAPEMPGHPDIPGAPMPPRGPRKMMRPLQDLHLNMLEGQVSETIQKLHIKPNAPFNGKLNVHFTAPNKGNVVISVSDLNGKELASEQIKDFQGDYLGQIDIKKAAKGVYFIRVVQGEDGAVRRVKVD